MKKSLVLISSLLVVIGVFTSSSWAHGGGHGHHGKRGHHGHAQIFSAKLTPPTAPTAAVARYHRGGSTGSTGATEATGPVGKVLYAQNKTKYAVGVRVYKLSPATKYDVAIYATATDAVLNPPTIGSITTDANGNGKAGTRGLLGTDFAGLDKKTAYYVKVTDAAGATVLRGDLTRKGHKGHKGKCDLKKETGTESFRGKHRH
jgi:hypothetical protein